MLRVFLCRGNMNKEEFLADIKKCIQETIREEIQVFNKIMEQDMIDKLDMLLQHKPTDDDNRR